MKFFSRSSVALASLVVISSVVCYWQGLFVVKSRIDAFDSVLKELALVQDRQADLLDRFHGFNNETGVDELIVPNIIHYIRFKKKSWSFVEYICLRSAYVQQRPDYIFIHTDVIGGFRGKYWKWMQDEADLKSRLVILPAEMPTEIFGQPISEMWQPNHGSDLTRIRLLMKYGGIYLDNDVYVVNNLDKYRKFEMTVGWLNKPNETLGNMVFIANKNARFLPLYLDSYRDYRQGEWLVVLYV